nr:MAG TPA: hypothetical protein [Caudoviricetes sp.]
MQRKKAVTCWFTIGVSVRQEPQKILLASFC